MLTHRGRVALVLAVAMLIAGRLLGVTELFGLAAAVLAVVLVAIARVRAPHLRVNLSAAAAPPVVSVGDQAALELAVENSGSLPTPARRLQLVPAAGAEGPLVEVPRLVPGERATVALRLPTDRRGRHEVTGFDAILVDGLGTARRRVSGIGPSRYRVRPVAEPLTTSLPTGGGGAELETTRSSAERLRSGASLLRTYVAGDDLRRVHWPTTARVGDLMVREGGDREVDATTGITVVLSTYVLGKDATAGDRFEHAVGISASVLTAAVREGSFRLVVPGGTDTGDGTGMRHLDLVLDTLTDVRGEAPPRGAAPHPPSLARGSLEERIVVFVAACDSPEAAATFFGAEPDALVPYSSPVVVICAGADESDIEAVNRRHLVVKAAIGDSLEALWTAGESSLVRA